MAEAGVAQVTVDSNRLRTGQKRCGEKRQIRIQRGVNTKKFREKRTDDMKEN